MGCCLVLVLLAGAPRVALLFWWLFDPARISATFQTSVFSPAGGVLSAWVWPVAGFIFLPWTTVAYVFVAPGGLNPIKWIILGIALLVDLGSHGGGGAEYRRRRSN
jgi:hypothetical protein